MLKESLFLLGPVLIGECKLASSKPLGLFKHHINLKLFCTMFVILSIQPHTDFVSKLLFVLSQVWDTEKKV